MMPAEVLLGPLAVSRQWGGKGSNVDLSAWDNLSLSVRWVLRTNLKADGFWERFWCSNGWRASVWSAWSTEHGIYFVTTGTLHKQRLFDTPAKLDLLERMLLSLARKCSWQLEAWAVFVNHYHFVARGAPDSAPMQGFLKELHSRSAIALNRMDGVEKRAVWHNFWDTRLTSIIRFLGLHTKQELLSCRLF